MRQRIQLWQWPNLLGLDAGLIAVAWLAVFAAENGTQGPGGTAYLVLGISVWLTYIADRLLDTARRPMNQLLSSRHRFAKHYRVALWRIWAAALIFVIGLAFFGLSRAQLFNGSLLLLLCLAYTALNQTLSKRFFPKEILVAIIFTAGTQIFLPTPAIDLSVFALALLCLTNCLLIADKERDIDVVMKVHSLIPLLSRKALLLLIGFTLIAATISDLPLALLAPTLALALLFLKRESVPTEAYRVLCDTALLLGPFVSLLAASFLIW